MTEDVPFALRTLRRWPAYTAATIAPRAARYSASCCGRGSRSFAALFIGAGTLAGLGPPRRATSIDSLVALKAE